MVKRLENWDCIIPLWQEAFGDSEEEIRFFLNNVRRAECVAYEEDGAVKAMMFLVRCRLNQTEGKYIYAACTAKKARGRGYMTTLLRSCTQQEPMLCLIPASDGLVNYYTDRGFSNKAAISQLSFEENAAVYEYLLEGYQLTEPCVLYL